MGSDHAAAALPIKYVLFVCRHNAGRSQIAQAFFERYAPPGVRADSAGSEPVAALWPEVIEAMREVGIDLSDRKPMGLTVELQRRADLAVTMGCGDACPYVPTTVEDWELPDPAGRPLAEVRAVRDLIETRVRELIGRIEALNASQPAHAASRQGKSPRGGVDGRAE